MPGSTNSYYEKFVHLYAEAQAQVKERTKLRGEIAALTNEQTNLRGEITALASERNLFKANFLACVNDTTATFHTLTLEDKWEEQLHAKDDQLVAVTEKREQVRSAQTPIADSIAKLSERIRQLETSRDAHVTRAEEWRLEAEKARQTIFALQGTLERIREASAEWQGEHHEKGV